MESFKLSEERICPVCGRPLVFNRWGDYGGPWDRVVSGHMCLHCAKLVANGTYYGYRSQKISTRLFILSVFLILGSIAFQAFFKKIEIIIPIAGIAIVLAFLGWRRRRAGIKASKLADQIRRILKENKIIVDHP